MKARIRKKTGEKEADDEYPMNEMEVGDFAVLTKHSNRSKYEGYIIFKGVDYWYILNSRKGEKFSGCMDNCRVTPIPDDQEIVIS